MLFRNNITIDSSVAIGDIKKWEQQSVCDKYLADISLIFKQKALIESLLFVIKKKGKRGE